MKRWQLWLGLVIGILCIAYVVSTIKNPEAFLQAIKGANYLYLLPITAAYLFIMVMRAVRWQYILNHSGRAGFGPSLAGILVCYMGNNIFPLRAGELMRVFLIGKREQSISYSGALASVVVERLFDFLVVLLSLAGVLMIIKFPAGGIPITIGQETYDLAAVFRSFGAGTLAGALVLFGFLVLLNARTQWVMAIANRVTGFLTRWYDRRAEERLLKKVLKERPARWTEAALAALERFAAGLIIMGRPRALIALLAMSLAIWTVNLSPVWLSGMAFTEIGSMDFMACAFLLVVGAAAASIPGPPGFFGIYHAFTQAAILFYINEILGRPLSPETALSFAIILHGCYYFPLTVAGAIAAWREGYSLTKLRDDAEHTQADDPESPGQDDQAVK